MLTNYCTPAIFYFVTSVISLMLIVVSHVPFVYILFKIAFIAMWTWFLNFICKKGYSKVSWFLVIAPFVMMMTFLVSGKVEGLGKKSELNS